MNRFVVGFLFSKDKEKVLLIKKNRPDFQKGKLNGIGGHIEENESPREAMKREGIEECALSPRWKQVGLMAGINNDGSEFECFIFSSFSNTIFNYRQKEDEQLHLFNVKDALHEEHIANLEFIIPYCLCEDHSTFLKIKY